MAHEFKYKLQHQLDKLPRTTSVGAIERILAKEHGISRDMFYRHRKIPFGSPKSISDDHLQIYAGLFGVAVSDLKNETIKVKPLSKRPTSAFAKKIGLKKVTKA